MEACRALVGWWLFGIIPALKGAPPVDVGDGIIIITPPIIRNNLVTIIY
jgi:hypothetical protein